VTETHRPRRLLERRRRDRAGRLAERDDLAHRAMLFVIILS